MWKKKNVAFHETGYRNEPSMVGTRICNYMKLKIDSAEILLLTDNIFSIKYRAAKSEEKIGIATTVSLKAITHSSRVLKSILVFFTETNAFARCLPDMF